jgi:hypothetical protein
MIPASLAKREWLKFPQFSATVLTILAGVTLFANGCGKQATPATAPAAPSPSSQLRVSASADGVVVDTSTAEFVLRPTGYVAASLTSNNGKLSLDDAGTDPGIQVIAGGKEISDVAFDVAHPQISEPNGRLGTKGKRIEVKGKNSAGDMEESLIVEVYDDFPNIALVSSAIRNSGNKEVKLDTVDLDRHRLNASLTDPTATPNEMWSFHGASIEWGKDNVFKIPKKFSQQNQMGSLVEVKGDLGRVGGGIPVVAFWTKTVGEAIGHVETPAAGSLDSCGNGIRRARRRSRSSNAERHIAAWRSLFHASNVRRCLCRRLLRATANLFRRDRRGRPEKACEQ